MNTQIAEIQVPVTEAVADSSYEAPRIESVLTPEDLEREVAYAGGVAGSGVALA